MSTEPTISDHLIAFIFSANSTCLYRKNLWLRMRAKRKNLHAAAFRQSLHRLNKKGVIKTRGDLIYIHRKNLSKLLARNTSVMKNVLPGKTEKILISFDISETKKKARDWLRNQIRFWDFKMVHQSLWLGYGPLPKEFNDRLRQLGIHGDVRIFKIIKAP